MNSARACALSTLITLTLGLSTTKSFCQERLRGPLPQEQKQIIQFLSSNHKKLTRTVTLKDDGYTATTTTEDKELADKLKKHFAYMEKRLDSGAMVRRWDPAFVELVSYYDQLTTTITYLDNGISVVVAGKTPEAVKAAQNHAAIVSGFVKEGSAAVQQKHNVANKEKE